MRCPMYSAKEAEDAMSIKTQRRVKRCLLLDFEKILTNFSFNLPFSFHGAAPSHEKSEAAAHLIARARRWPSGGWFSALSGEATSLLLAEISISIVVGPRVLGAVWFSFQRSYEEQHQSETFLPMFR